MAAEKEFTAADVAKHNTAEDCWLIIGNENTGKLPTMHYMWRMWQLLAVVIIMEVIDSMTRICCTLDAIYCYCSWSWKCACVVAAVFD